MCEENDKFICLKLKENDKIICLSDNTIEGKKMLKRYQRKLKTYGFNLETYEDVIEVNWSNFSDLGEKLLEVHGGKVFTREEYRRNLKREKELNEI